MEITYVKDVMKLIYEFILHRHDDIVTLSIRNEYSVFVKQHIL